MKHRYKTASKLIHNRRRGKVINPLRIDPTRTITLRRSFSNQLKKKFALLKGRIVKLLIDQDVLGLKSQTHTTAPIVDNEIIRDAIGRFASKMAAYSAKQAGQAEHWAASKIAKTVDNLPAAARLPIKGAYLAISATYTVGQAAAERVARERGLSDDQAHRLRGILATADALAAKPSAILGGITGIGHSIGFVPLASAGYLMYSTARNPMATYRAAKQAVQDVIHSAKSAYDTLRNPLGKAGLALNVEDRAIDQLADALEDHNYDDWYIALLHASLEDGQSLEESLETADQDYELNDQGFPTENANLNHDEKGRFASGATSEAEDKAAKGAANFIHRWSWGGKEGTPKVLPNTAVSDMLAHSKPTEPITLYRFEREDHDPAKAHMGQDRYKMPLQAWSKDKEMVKGVAQSIGESEGAKYVIKQRTFQPHEIFADFSNIPAPVKHHLEKIGGDSGMSEVLVPHYFTKGAKVVNARTAEVVLTYTGNAAEWAAIPDAEVIKAFQQWLSTQLEELLTNDTEEQLWEAYCRQGYLKGAGRAFDDVNKANQSATVGDQSKLDFYNGSREQFLRSSFGQAVSVEKVKLLAGRSYDDLEGVTSDMSVKMSRALTDGLVEGKGMKDIASDLTEQADLSKERALTVARTEIIRAHAEGQLDAMEDLGLEEVGVAVEWSTANDNAVCDECSPMEGVVLKIDEAHGMIPAHPNCRCAFIPANVGENTDGQKRTKKAIDKAIGQTDLDLDVDEDRPESVLNRLDSFSLYLVNEFNADQPRDSHGKWTKGSSSEVPHPHDLTTIKSLGGSTGAKLTQENGTANQWVMKNTSGKLTTDHLKNEIDADAAYRALGIATPYSSLTGGIGEEAKVSKFMDGAKSLAEWETGKSPDEKAAMYKEISKGLAADALLANWDVVGLGKDNIMIADGKPYRMDNGGALKYRAQGGPKGSAFGATVTELESMRYSPKNPSATSVFGNVTNQELGHQIKDVLSKREDVLKAVSDPTTRQVLSQRMDHMQNLLNSGVYGAEHQKVPTLTPVKQDDWISKLPAVEKPVEGSHLTSGEGLAKYVEKNKGYEKLSPLFTAKLEALNPQGAGVGKVYIPHQGSPAKNQEKAAILAKILPPGTKIIAKNISAKDIGFKGGIMTTKEADTSKFGGASKPEPIAKPAFAGQNLQQTEFKPDLNKHSEPVIASLTAAERKAIVAYTGSSYGGLNATMRKCPPDFGCVEGHYKELMTSIESGLAKAPPFESPIVLHRGLSISDKEEHSAFLKALTESKDEGKIITMPSITSTSTKSYRSASPGQNGFGLRITSKTGLFVKSISQYPGESEVMKSAKCKYKVTGVTTHGTSGHIIELEEIL